MIARTTAFLAGLLAACAQGPTSPAPAAVPGAPAGPEAAPVVRGKPAAPVEIEAALGPGAARLTLVFGADASDVAVRLSGLDGLRVTSAAAPVERASYRRGERVALEAAFVPGEGRSRLVLAVEGTFAGARRTLVRAFAVGSPGPAQAEKADVVTDPQGERLHLVPAERR